MILTATQTLLSSKTAKQRIGETNTATNGQLMTIVDYYNWKKVTVKFEDGTLVETAYNQFTQGKVTNPNKPVSALNDRTGYSDIMENGLRLTVTNYRLTSDLDATFEDGTVCGKNTGLLLCMESYLRM